MKDLSLRKTCIAEMGIDPHLLMSYVSPFTMKKAKDKIDSIVSKFEPDRSLIEEKVVKEIDDIWKKSVRNKKFAKILLHVAFHDYGAISGQTYHKLRRDMGIVQYDDKTKDSIEEKWENEQSSDPFGYLTKNNQQLEGETQWL